MYDKNAKSERILAKLHTFTSEYICICLLYTSDAADE